MRASTSKSPTSTLKRRAAGSNESSSASPPSAAEELSIRVLGGPRKRRVRTGCLQCRIRRVKCQEGEAIHGPSGEKLPCRWCATRGVECLYPAAPTGLSRNVEGTAEEESSHLDPIAVAAEGWGKVKKTKEGVKKRRKRSTTVKREDRDEEDEDDASFGSQDQLELVPRATTSFATLQLPINTTTSYNPSWSTGLPGCPTLDFEGQVPTFWTGYDYRTALLASQAPIITFPQTISQSHFQQSVPPLESELLAHFYTSFMDGGPDYFSKNPTPWTRFENHLLPYLNHLFSSPDTNLDLQQFVYHSTIALSAAHRVALGGPGTPTFHEAFLDHQSKAKRALNNARQSALSGDDKILVGSFLSIGCSLFLYHSVELDIQPIELISTSIPTTNATMAHGARDILSAISIILALCEPMPPRTIALQSGANFNNHGFPFPDFVSAAHPTPFASGPKVEEEMDSSKIIPLSFSDTPMLPMMFGASRRLFRTMGVTTTVLRKNLALKALGPAALEQANVWKLVGLQEEAHKLYYSLGPGWAFQEEDWPEPCTSEEVEQGTEMYRCMLQVLLLCEVLSVPVGDGRVHKALARVVEIATRMEDVTLLEPFGTVFALCGIYCLNVHQREEFKTLLGIVSTLVKKGVNDFVGMQLVLRCWQVIDYSTPTYYVVPWREQLRSLGLNLFV